LDGDRQKGKRLTASGTKFDRSIYLGTPLSVQVVAPRLQERKLVEAMSAIDGAIRNAAPVSAKL
jgi:amidase